MKKLSLHPLTWWIWAIGLAIAVIRFDNTVFTLSCVGAVAVVVFINRENAPWGKSFNWTLKLSAWILLVRTVIGVLIGVPIPGTTLFTIPILPLPSWMPGIRIGGTVTAERLTSALTEGILICVIIVIFGAAASLTSPHRLLRAFSECSVRDAWIELQFNETILNQFDFWAGRTSTVCLRQRQLRHRDHGRWSDNLSDRCRRRIRSVCRAGII